MKQILVCYKENRSLRVRANILTDVFVPVEDIISPQKTTLIVPKNDKIQLSDIVIIKDNSSSKIEYIGYIDTLSNKVTTEMNCYPLINVFDNDFVLDQMFKTMNKGQYNNSGVWVEDATQKEDVDIDATIWLYNQIERAFIDTDDDLQALPLIIENKVKTPVFYKKALDTSNLFEVYVDLFINTGLYVVFSDLVYNQNEITGIKCEIRSNRDERLYRIYEHDVSIQKVEIIDHTFGNYNKIIATEELPKDDNGYPVYKKDGNGNDIPPQRYYFYLLNNNDITTEPNDEVRIQQEIDEGLPENSLGRRIKQVRSKEISFELEEEGTQEENARALILSIYNELQAPEYDLKIEIEMLKKDNLFLYRKVDFIANSGIIYTSNITKIERLNDKQVRITLGALRNSLTDFKKKVEVI